jgi:hypothetical protein
MKEIIISSVEGFHKQLDSYRKQSRFKFRGQSDCEWLLLPKAGRPPYTNNSDQENFRNWKRRAIAYLDRKHYTELEFLAIAQHTGLPTRMLDWTHNPLAAAFFATVDHQNKDGAVYAYKPENIYIDHEADPFQLKTKVMFYQPTASSTRIINQSGYFSIHSDAQQALNDSTKKGVLEKIVIKASAKADLLFMLNQYGVNYASLFPDLEGLSKHLCWWSENYKYWGGAWDDVGVAESIGTLNIP